MVFVLWTILIQVFDVKPERIFGTNVGFATVNTWFHNLTGVHMKIYTITDCLILSLYLYAWVLDCWDYVSGSKEENF